MTETEYRIHLKLRHGRHSVDNSEIPQIPMPPVEEWMREEVKAGNIHFALYLVAYVFELQLSEGARLLKVLAKEAFHNDSAKLLETMVGITSVVNGQPSFFNDLIRGLWNFYNTYIPNVKMPPQYESLYKTLKKMHNDFGPFQKSLSMRSFIRSVSENFGSDAERVLERLDEIDTYYAQFVIPHLDFPELPPKPKREKWQDTLIRTGEIVATQKEGEELSLGKILLIKQAGRLANLHLDESGKSIKEISAEDEVEADYPEGFVHTFSAYELFKNVSDVSDIQAVATTKRGVILSLKRSGYTYYWFDGYMFRLDSLQSAVVETTQHFLLMGKRGGKNINIINGIEYPDYEIDNYFKEGDNLILVGYKDENSNEVTIWINGQMVSIGAPKYCKQKDGKLYIVANTNKSSNIDGSTGYVFNAETLDIEDHFGAPYTHGIYIFDEKSTYFVSGNNQVAVLVSREQKKYFYPQLNTFLDSPFNKSTDQDRTSYHVFEISESKYIAYSTSPRDFKTPYLVLHRLGDSDQFLATNSENGTVETYYQQEVNGQVVFKRETVVIGNSEIPATEGIFTAPVTKKIDRYEDRLIINLSEEHQVFINENDDGIKQDFQIWVGNRNEESSKGRNFLDAEAILKGVCVDKDSDVYFTKRDSLTGDSHFFKNYTRLAVSHSAGISMIDVYDGKPVVVVEGENTPNGKELDLYWGDQKIDIWREGDEVIRGFRPISRDLNAIGFFNPKTGVVKEIGRIGLKQDDAEKTTLLETEFDYKRLVELIQMYGEAYSELSSLQQGYLDEEEHNNEDTRQRIAVCKANMLAAQTELKELLEINDQLRHIYAIKKHEKNFIKNLLLSKSRSLLELYPPELDPKSISFNEEIIKVLLPELWEFEEKKRIFEEQEELEEQLRKGLVTHGDATESFLQTEQQVDPTLSEKSYFYKGGNAETQFLVGEPLGKIDNPNSRVVQGVWYQKEKGWNILPLPATTTALKFNPTRYTHFISPNKNIHEKKAHLLLKPGRQIDVDSVIVTTENGDVFPVQVEVEKGYVMVDLPNNAKEIRYEDVENIVSMPQVSWQEYQGFAEQFEKREREFFKGLSEDLPLDSRLELQISQSKGKDPLQAVIELEKLCRVSGHYDFNNAETENDRKKLSTKDTLEFARSRAWGLRLNAAAYGVEIKESQYYAGVCYESALLLIAMLRKLGFLAGLVTEYRPKADGIYSKYDAHASAGVLWPADNELGYQIIYLDGTFINLRRQSEVPTAAPLMEEKIELGEVKVEEKDELLLDKRDENEIKNKKEMDLPLEVQFPKHVDLNSFSPIEQNLIKELQQNFTKNDLEILYYFLIEVMYAPKTEVTAAFKSLSSIEEKFAWIKSYSVKEKGTLKVDLKLMMADFTKEQLINAIMFTLRK